VPPPIAYVPGSTMSESASKRQKLEKLGELAADECGAAASTVAPSEGDDALSVLAASEAGAADAGSAAVYMETLWATAAGDVGEPLTEANLGVFEVGLDKVATQLRQQQGAEEKDELLDLTSHQQRKYAALRAAVTEGKMEATSYLAKTFRQALSDDSLKTFSKLGRTEQAAFRLEWAKTQYGSFREEKIKQKSWRRIDVKKGTYLNMSNLVASEGGGFGDVEAVRGVQRLVAMCLAMGPPWTMRHPQTGRMLFLKLDFSYVEEFDELFQQCKKEFDNGVLIPGDGQPDTQVPAMIVDKVGETKVAACALVKAKAKATSSPQAKSKASEATESDKKFGKLWADATKLRMALIRVLGSAQHMLDTMATGVEWEWAHHPIQQAFVWGWTPSTPQQSQTNITSENIKIKGA
jgi:hypothetical protein